jgi:DNA repair protein RadA/Sms
MHPKWVGQCTACGAWNSLIEDVEGPDDGAGSATAGYALAPAGVPTPLNQVNLTAGRPQPTGLTELDRVLGGGLVPGSVTLLGGEPGVGKSTLLLQLLGRWPHRSLYVSAEESAAQVRLRAERLGVADDRVWLVAETSLPNLLTALDTVQPTLVVVDSVQTIADPELGSAPGSVVQVRGCAHRLVQEAKRRDLCMVLVGHVTKDGGLAGPRVLEHVVDTVLTFDGERHHSLRMLRATKHRFGPTNELGLFDMVDSGLQAVPDPSQVFLGDRRTGVPGSAVVPTVEGHRPLLVEVQALTVPVAHGAPPRRSAQGVDSGRMAVLLAVLERRARISLARSEAYVSVVGGVKLDDPGTDLGVCLALASAHNNRPLPPQLVAIGEVGLAGEVRQVAHLERRLHEAARLGYRQALVPASSTVRVHGITATPVASLAEAFTAACLTGTGNLPL